jgi:hypothetical protein
MPCVPCQVILWDQRATGMLESVDKLVTLKMQGVKIPLTDKWQEEWYELIKASCTKMQEMIDHLTGVYDG